jgi:hypothetical protein
MKKNYHHPAFVQHKKSPMNLFSIYHMKKKYYTREGKKFKRKKNKNLNLG